MEKPFYYSMTFWGAVGFGLVTFLEGLTGLNPELATYGKTLAGVLTAFGFRRAMK